MRKVVVTIRYVSPADGRSHDGILTMGSNEAMRNHLTGGTGLVGAIGPVMVSTQNPELFHYDTWAFGASASR